MTVADMLSRMSAMEFREWRAFSEIEPWGEEREDLRAGMIASPIINAVLHKRVTKPSAWICDFLPKLQDLDEMKYVLMAITIGQGGKVRKTNGN